MTATDLLLYSLQEDERAQVVELEELYARKEVTMIR